jgi:hypothetical protein
MILIPPFFPRCSLEAEIASRDRKSDIHPIGRVPGSATGGYHMK